MELYELRHVANLALDVIAGDPSVLESEVCVSWCEQQIAELSHDTHRSDAAGRSLREETVYGLSILAVLADGAGVKVGFGVDRNDLSRDSVILALDIAKQSAMADRGFASLPRPLHSGSPDSTLHDAAVVGLPEDAVAALASETLDGALSTFSEAGVEDSILLKGEVCSRAGNAGCRQFARPAGRGHVDFASGHLARPYRRAAGLRPRQPQRHPSKEFLAARRGRGGCHRNPARAGRHDAAGRRLRGHIRPQGRGRPVPGPAASRAQPRHPGKTAAVHLPTCFDQRIAAPFLTVADEGRYPGLIGSRSITGDGLPTGTTNLITDGRLSGFLGNAYHAQTMAATFPAMPPRNGMRHALNGESFAMRPGVFPTNVTFNSDEAVPRDALIAPITAGIYVGGLWAAAYRRGGAPGDFTATVAGPSFHILDGRLAQPLQPRTLHIEDNIHGVLQRLTALSSLRRPVVMTTGQSVVLAPELRCSRVRVAQRRG